MSLENQRHPTEGEIVPDESQTMYSEFFVTSSYPFQGFPFNEVYQDSPRVFSEKFASWKEELLAESVAPQDQEIRQQLEKVSLFEIFKISERRLMEAEFKLNSYDEGEVMGRSFDPLMKNVNYWNWIHTKSYLASQLWKGEEQNGNLE